MRPIVELRMLGVALALGLACKPLTYAELPDDSGGAGDGGAGDGGATEVPDCPIETGPVPEGIGADDWTEAVALQGGDVDQLVVAATDPDIVWAGSAQNGLWRSHDGGLSWSLAQTFVSHTYGQIALHPTDPELFAYSTDQGWITTDGGDSFTMMGLAFGSTDDAVRGLAWHGDALYAVQLSGQVHRSDDLGATWQSLGSVPTPVMLPAPPSGGHDQKADLWLGVTTSGTVLAASSGNGLYRSTDGGESFALVLPASVGGALLAVRGEEVVVGVHGTTTTEVFGSDDGGDSWTSRARVDAPLTSLWLGPDGELLGTSTTGTWSEEGGLATLDGEGWGRFMAIARAGEGNLLVGHRLGVLGSADGGATFTDWSEEMVDADLINLAVHPSCPGLVFTGTQCRSGLYRSVDYGQSFDRPVDVDMHYTMSTAASLAAPAEIWSASDDLLWWSDDLGETWTSFVPKSMGGMTGMGVHLHGLAVHPTRPERVIVGSVGSGDYADDGAHLYVTEDRGETWQALGTGLPETEESFHALHFLLTDPEVVLLGTFPAGEGVTHKGGDGVGMYRSADGGESWTRVDVEALSVQHFAECDGVVYAASDAGVLRSADGGQAWQVVRAASQGVKHVACLGGLVLAIDPGFGVQRSDDGGETWTDWTGSLQVTLGPINNQVGLAISPDGRFAYTAVPGQGFAMRALQ